MSETVREYLLSNHKAALVEQTIEKLAKHPDLCEEFAEWIVTRRFREDGIHVEGVTAAALYATGKLSPTGVYNYLVYLREKPQEALANLRRGLPRR